MSETLAIRPATAADLPEIGAVINDAAVAYRGVIPADCWHEPYMPMDELVRQFEDGIAFSCALDDGAISGVMGLQDKGEVALIRHAYVRTRQRRSGIGAALLGHLLGGRDQPVLIGTWKAARWAVAFYQKHGFRVVPEIRTAALLRRYWSIPERQIETSVVLASADYPAPGA